MPLPPSGFLAGRLFYDLEGQAIDDAEITFGVSSSSFGTSLVNDIYDFMTDSLKEALDGSAAITRLEMTDDTAVTISSTNAAVGGTATGGAGVPQAAYVVKKVGTTGGRRNRGRWYLPGISEGKVDGAGNVDATFAGLRQADMDILLAAFDGNSVPLHILHADLSTPTPVAQLLFEGKIGTQRRRLHR